MRTRSWLCIVSVMMTVLGTLVLPPAGADSRGPRANADTEPNNDFAHAVEVTPSGSSIQFSGSADSTDDTDYYKIQLSFNPPSANKLTVSTDCSQGIKRLFLYDPLGKFILMDGDANQFNTHTVSTVAFTSGYYYIRYEVQGLQNAASYSITFTKTSVTYTGDGNSTPSTAIQIDSDSYSVGGTLDDPNDQADWYSLDLTNDDFLAHVVTFSGAPAASLAMRIEIYYPNLTFMEPFHYEPVGPNDTPSGTKDEGSFGAPLTGTYYIRALAVDGSGSYTLRVWRTTVEKDTSNSPETAMGLSDIVDSHYYEFNGTLGKDVDIEDWYSFPASLGQIVNATLYSLDYNYTMDRPQIIPELRNSGNKPYGTSSGIAKNVSHADGISPEDTQTSYIRISIMNYVGGAGGYFVNLSLNMPPAIYPGTWETPFTVNESSNATMDLSTVFYDEDGDPLTYSGINNGQGMTIIRFSGQNAIFTALQAEWIGMENWTITARDPFGYTAQANIHVSVVPVNHPPYIIAHDIKDLSTNPGVVLDSPFNLSRNFGDPDVDNQATSEDYLTYHFKDNGEIKITFQIIPRTIRPSGAVTVYVPEMPDLTVPFTQTVLFWATDTFNLSTPMIPCNITIGPPLNNPPRWSANFTQIEMNESTPAFLTEKVLDLATYCSDIDPWDRDNVTYTALNYNMAALTITITKSFVKIAPRVGFYTLPPHEGITFTATDTKMATADKTVRLVVNHVYSPPTFSGSLPKNQSVELEEGQNMTFVVEVRIDAFIANQTPSPIKYRWTVNGTLQREGGPNFTFRTDPTSAARSPYNVTIYFNDSYTEISRSWKISVLNLNLPPVNVKIITPATTNFTQGDRVELRAALASDPDDPNATLNYQWKVDGVVKATGPTFATADLSPGTVRIVLAVSDADGETVEDSITITIKPAPKAGGFLPGMELLGLLAAIGAAAAVAIRARKR